MALIDCLECGHKVSNTAASCPSCGAPIAEAVGSLAAGTPLTTVQETSKKLKLHIIIASAFFWIGVIWLFTSATSVGGKASVAASYLTLIGLVWYIVTRFRIWWHHK